MQEQIVSTNRGTLWTACSTPVEASEMTPTILFIHGNSVDSRIFDPLLANETLKKTYRLIVFDFPGHGRSSNAPEPNEAYFQYGYAESALSVLQHYNVKTVIPVGWSLGGHVALELIPVLATPKNTTKIRMIGAVITGTPPVRKQKIEGFRGDCDISALFKPDASRESLLRTANDFVDVKPTPPWLIESMLRTDRAAGQTMVVKFMQGHCSDQIELVHDFKDGPVAVINGADDHFLDPEYCDKVCKGAPNLWKGEAIRLPGLRHTPMYDAPDVYGDVLLEFLSDCEARQK